MHIPSFTASFPSDTATCGPSQFACASGGCIDAEWRCDHDIDCRDASDEEFCCESAFHYCVINHVIYEKSSADDQVECEEDQMLCADGRKCVLHVYACDGDNNCGDWSDEQNCDRESFEFFDFNSNCILCMMLQVLTRAALLTSSNASMVNASMLHGNVMEIWIAMINLTNKNVVCLDSFLFF
jgi:hypothetical protein